MPAKTIFEEDLQLATQIKQGDMNAFEKLYQIHHNRVYSLCLKIVKNTNISEDLCQEVFIQIWHKIKNYKGEAKLSTWIHKITVNQCLMYFRKASVKREKDSLEDDSVEMSIVRSKMTSKPQTDLSIELSRAINQLPRGYKDVFILKVIHGLEHSEVAAILGCTEGTSKSQVHKAKEKLIKLLGKKANPRVITAFS